MDKNSVILKDNFEFDKSGRLLTSENNQTRMKDLLDSIGPGFCLAKWTQVTLHLGNGLTHSCHHPTAHKIPLDEIKENPNSLHNTKFKKERRKEMINGQRPEECDYCWRVEDAGEISDRVYKSMDEYSFDHYNKISKLDSSEDIFPTYVEVSFDRTCNFKCAYCGPAYSSKWYEEIKNENYYDLLEMKFNIIKEDEDHILHKDYNPYIETFWKWFPEAYKYMHTFRITGGEPLLIKDTWKVIDFLMENPNPNLNFAINSNGCPLPDQWKKFVEKVQYLQENKCVKSFVLFSSAESSGEQNNYIRDGMDYEKWKHNMEYFLSNTEGTGLTIMAAFNLLSISGWKDLLKWVLVQKQNYNYVGWDTWLHDKGIFREPDNVGAVPMYKRTNDQYKKRNRVIIDTPYVRAPGFLDASIVTTDLIAEYLVPALDFVYDNFGSGDWKANKGFDAWEANKMRRNLITIINRSQKNFQKFPKHQDKGCNLTAAQVFDAVVGNDTISKSMTIDSSIRLDRSRFYLWVQEYDRRRGKNFLKIFPEYTHFFNVCEAEYKVYNELKNGLGKTSQ